MNYSHKLTREEFHWQGTQLFFEKYSVNICITSLAWFLTSLARVFGKGSHEPVTSSDRQNSCKISLVSKFSCSAKL